MRLPILLLLCLSICLTACGPNLEVREETDDLGYRKAYQVDAEGKKQGFLREYDAEGHLLVEENYTDDELNGIRKVYGGEGLVIAEENIVMGQYTGEHRTYNEDGSLAMRGVYTDGAMNGLWYSFHSNGSVKAEMTFKDNTQEGPIRQWYPDGKPELSGNYADGEDFKGPLIRYDASGKIERILDCDPNRGCRTFWTPDSTAVMPIEAVDMTQPEGR